MEIKGKAILEKLAAAQKSDRTKVSLYLSKSLYKRFKSQCDKVDVPASVAMEELLEQFLNSLEK